ncbi:MAG TPA: aminodeoxychorismate synthase component I [Pyrinomonadaceae bacterium]|nr:aminodeoxychorismate synthase component I [Pyrinomonadaceae bacterium]
MTSLFGSAITTGWSLYLTAPTKVLLASSVGEVRDLINQAEAAAKNGSYVAMIVNYEAAPAFDSALKTKQPTSFPLAWAAIYSGSCEAPAPKPGEYQVSKWIPAIDRNEYNESVDRVRELIAAGDTYQVNYTFPLEADFAGDPPTWYQDLCVAQGGKYSALLDLGRFTVLSLSPELFFQRIGDEIVTRPMKGTAKRGRWAAEDQQQAAWLQNSTKNRAENIMIVDLVRNDLGKVSELGSVRVSSFFELEKFPTLWQLTSTVESRLCKNTSLWDLFTALFPCGSITGAPKIRTMEIIEELETNARGPYTGAIGFLRPGGDCIFNVAIRTVVFDSSSNKVSFSVGGGITIDSTSELEYEECLLKAEFLTRKPIPFNLFESISLEEGKYFLLDRHLERLAASAHYFDFEFNKSAIESELRRIVTTHDKGAWKVRLEIDRRGRIKTTVSEISGAEPRKVALASRPADPDDVFLFHKTTNRKFYEDELVLRPDCDDIIFWNEAGEVTESTIANVVVRLDDHLVTPAIESGLLAGTYRDQLIAEGTIVERRITVDDLSRTSEIFLINSVRKWMRVSHLRGINLLNSSSTQAGKNKAVS